MDTIIPTRTVVSHRFPVVSFLVRVPPQRCFEIVCATDARLLHSDNHASRTPDNFFTTRDEGLLRAPGGEVCYLVPVENLERLSHGKRLYYALASYGNVRGDEAKFSVPLNQLSSVPHLRISPDLQRRAFGGRRKTLPQRSNYGMRRTKLTWGGDRVMMAANGHRESELDYDDGYGSALWRRQGQSDGGAVSSAPPAPPPRPRANGNGPSSAEAGYPDATHGVPRNSGAPAVAEPRLAPRSVGDANGSPVTERPGFEDPVELRMSGQTPQAQGVRSFAEEAPPEPPGFEDPWQLRQAGGTAMPVAGSEDGNGLHNGNGNGTGSHNGNGGASPADLGGNGHARSQSRYTGASQFAPSADQPSGGTQTLTTPHYGRRTRYKPPGRHREYQEEGMAAPAGTAYALAGEEAPPAANLDARAKFESILVPIARFETGLDAADLQQAERRTAALADTFGAVNANSDGQGLSWGIVQFTQGGGMLAKALRLCHSRDRAEFQRTFGEHADTLLSVTGARAREERMSAVGGHDLWDDYWTERFRAAGAIRPFQEAQIQAAVEGYVDPNLQMMHWLGFNTDRAAAIYCDRCVQMGNAGGRTWILRHIGPVTSEELRGQALAALDHPTIESFQNSISGLTADGQWGPKTHAAMVFALRGLGAASPIAIPTLDQILDALTAAAEQEGRPWAHRIASLRTDPSFTDGIYNLLA